MQNRRDNYTTASFNIRPFSNFVHFIRRRSPLITLFPVPVRTRTAVISIRELFKLVFETIAPVGNNYAAGANFCCPSRWMIEIQLVNFCSSSVRNFPSLVLYKHNPNVGALSRKYTHHSNKLLKLQFKNDERARKQENTNRIKEKNVGCRESNHDLLYTRQVH